MKRGSFNLAHIQALIADMDGTLWRGEQPLPGLVEFARFLQRRGIGWMVVTNNTVEMPDRYRQRLARFGIQAGREQVLTAAEATAAYLQREWPPGATVFMIGQTGLAEALRAAGFRLAANAARPVDLVVVGGDTGLTYTRLKDAILLVQAGARFIGANPDLLVPTEEGLVPEAGTTLAAIRAATGVAPVIVGKPERLLFEMALTRLGREPGRTVMLGDRLETDILGGQRAGLDAILVTTGVDDEQAVIRTGIQPDLVVSGLAELVDLWEKAVAAK